MDSSSISLPQTTAQASRFTFSDGRESRDVHPDRDDVADKIDLNRDGFLDEDEINRYMARHNMIRNPELCQVDQRELVNDFKAYLQGIPTPSEEGSEAGESLTNMGVYSNGKYGFPGDLAKSGVDAREVIGELDADFLKKLSFPSKTYHTTSYHSYDEMTANLKSLAEQRPDICKLVSLGKSHEGRDIWALKISKGAQGDTSDKPGVVFTGAVHAREWISEEVPLYLANTLVNNYDSDEETKTRVDNSEIWIAPMLNPDGYEYSRTKDKYWRKNRRPITDIGKGDFRELGRKRTYGVGVDLNRNFYDGKPAHYDMWRPAGDLPFDYKDDFSATSDNPREDEYRGPDGASESEVKSILGLELGHKNIKGVIDFHAYGEVIIYPWAHKKEPVENAATYKKLGKKLNKALGNTYKVIAGADFDYMNSGSSDTVLQANKIINFTIELAKSFWPGKKTIEPICEKLYPACNAFVDWIIENKDEIPWRDNPSAA